MARIPTPDLLIGVDFGMTCTGVSYVNFSIGSDQVKWIQKWPGRRNANENKVPSILVYPDGEDTPKTWGFEAESFSTQENMHCVEWFKIFLDPAKLRLQQSRNPEGAPASIAEVEKFYKEYLQRLYQHIEAQLSREMYGKTWRDARVDFVFSLPSTWTDKSIVENFRSIIDRAGYRQHPGHSVSIGLTEAEAAAVHVSKEATGVFRQGNVFLVCDAGGGTTDLSVLRVASMSQQVMSLQQVDVVFGKTIGSVAIDFDFKSLVRERLDMAEQSRPTGLTSRELDDLAWSIMKEQAYQGMKCDLYVNPFSIRQLEPLNLAMVFANFDDDSGTSAANDLDTFSVPAPKLPPDYSNPEQMINNQSIKFARSDFQELFDKQIRKLIKLIDSQLGRLRQRIPTEQVSHLILSGGLGNSAYVQERLMQQYMSGVSSVYPNAQSMRVIVAPDPQLAVCKGIVADALQKLKGGPSVLNWRCCRESYGTLCKEPYNKNNPKHIGRTMERDPNTDVLFVTDSVDWFVKQGEPVSSDKPIEHPFTRRVAHNDPRRTFPAGIVMSTLPAHLLPPYKTNDVTLLCDITANLSSIDKRRFEDLNKRFWSKGRRHYAIKFTIKVIVGAADLLFELWFQGVKLSTDQPIQVQWHPAPDPAESPNGNMQDFERY